MGEADNHNTYILLPQALPACTLATDGMEHGDGLHEKEANVLTEHAAGKLLAAHSAPHLTVHDSESAMLITAAAAAVSMRMHVKEPNILHWHADGGTTGRSSCGATRNA